MNFKSSRANKILPPKHKSILPSSQSNASIPQPIKAIFRYFPPYWLACIPLAALIVIAWNAAASAQDFKAPANFDELRVMLDTVFISGNLYECWIWNARSGILSPKERGKCFSKKFNRICDRNSCLLDSRLCSHVWRG